MEVQIRPVTDFNEALRFVEELDRFAAESMAEYRDSPLPAGSVKRVLDKHFDNPCCLLLVAETDGADSKHVGVCLVAPLEDPLTGEQTPMIVILRVDHDLRHRGIARVIVKNAIEILAKRGQNTLAARAAHNDDALISMGERWGFLRQWELMVHE